MRNGFGSVTSVTALLMFAAGAFSSAFQRNPRAESFVSGAERIPGWPPGEDS